MLGWNEEVKPSLRSCGEQVFIGHNTMFTSPQWVCLGARTRIDPNVHITTSLITGSNVQIMAGAVLSGGWSMLVTMCDWTFIGYKSMLFTASEDYSGEHGPVNEFWGDNYVDKRDIFFSKFSGIASGVVLMPGVHLPQGCLIGANSFVYSDKDLEPWSVYVGGGRGRPLEKIKDRNKDKVIEFAQSKEFLKKHE